MSRNLISIEQWEEMQRAKLSATSPVPNGIMCPVCESSDAEMVDTSPNFRYMSNPPQKRIHCQICGYATTVIA